MNLGRILHFIFVLTFFGVAAFSVAFLYENYQELRAMEGQEAVAASKLKELKTESQRRRTALHKLEGDPEYIGRSIRKKLGYAEKDEVIFRFE